MNKAIIGTIIRWIGTLLAGTSFGAILIAAGVFDTATINNLIGRTTEAITALVAFGTLLFGIWQKIKAARELTKAKSLTK